MKLLSDDKINLLRHNARSVVRELGLLNDAYFDIGVTLAERHLLIELSCRLFPTVNEIAESLLLDKSTASKLIAKAVKKGYVSYTLDEKDKRKRYLQLTENGKKTLDAFEPIAFNQTKDALLTLSPKETEFVYQGIALYAKGLKTSRLRNKIATTKITKRDNASLAHLLADIYNKSNRLEWAHLFETYESKGSFYFVLKMDSKIIGGAGISIYKSVPKSCELGNICLQFDMQDLGLEKILIDFCIKEAKKLGYTQCCIDTAKETLFSSKFFQMLGFQSDKKSKRKTSLLWKAC